MNDWVTILSVFWELWLSRREKGKQMSNILTVTDTCEILIWQAVMKSFGRDPTQLMSHLIK